MNQRPGGWWERWYGADENLIEGNIIFGERNGIWVGSRMAENQYFMDCSDAAYLDAPLRRLHLDYAANNTLRGNLLIGVDNAIRVEDDGTVVEGNAIASNDPAARGILIGTKERTALLGRPVGGTVVRGNRAAIAGNPTPYTWIHDHRGTVFEGNLADEGPASLVAGTQPPINPFLMVVRAWLP